MTDSSVTSFIIENIESIFFFGILALAMNLFARSKGFFQLNKSHACPAKEALGFKNVASTFAIYIVFSVVVAPALAYILKQLLSWLSPRGSPSVFLFSYLQLVTTLLILYSLFAYCRAQNQEMMKKIWKDNTLPNRSPIIIDWIYGALTWILGFPVVAAIGQLCDFIIYLFFGMQAYEQVAVRYLKMTLGSAPMLLIALFTILIAAPIIEEFLFRGMLQTWVKNKLGTKAAIIISSICFSLFHLAGSQGLGNISLAISLFSFACFLGFIYEKKSSLFASIGLHMTFNAVSTFRILFFSDS